MNFKFLDENKGYIGIPELLVVVAIIAILTLVALINYPAARKQLALQRSASQLAQDIRRVQEMALAAEEVGGAIPAGGYGIHLKKVSLSPSGPPHTSYVLFADINSDQAYSPGSEKIGDDINFESGIKIKNLTANHINIIFVPPDPTTYLTNQDSQDLGGQVLIEISLIND
ncbi:MAG: type II secretion system protein, partial [Candidatus Nealsonbacteria bacterium]|nr:type II secretion system protein [Candidatus Nealsonbacteria bacterium]